FQSAEARASAMSDDLLEGDGLVRVGPKAENERLRCLLLSLLPDCPWPLTLSNFDEAEEMVVQAVCGATGLSRAEFMAMTPGQQLLYLRITIDKAGSDVEEKTEGGPPPAYSQTPPTPAGQGSTLAMTATDPTHQQGTPPADSMATPTAAETAQLTAVERA